MPMTEAVLHITCSSIEQDTTSPLAEGDFNVASATNRWER